MQRALLIAEKPSLMRDIEKVYKKMTLPIQIDFASFVGHVGNTWFFAERERLDTLN